jgi:hypothetical protein
MAFMHYDKSNGYIWMNKAEQSLFSRNWAIADSIPNLTDAERATLDLFGQRWFVGQNFKTDDAVYVDFMSLCKEKNLKWEREQRAYKTRPGRTIWYTTPKHWDGEIRGSQWPNNNRTKQMEGRTNQQVRADHRCAVRDEERKTLTPERQAFLSQRDEAASTRVELAQLREIVKAIPILTARISELEQTMHDLTVNVDTEVEQIKAGRVVHAGPYKAGERPAHPYTVPVQH